MDSKFRSMPYVSISKEAIKTLKRFLTKEEAFKSILAVADYIWDGVEPDNLSDKVKGGYDTIMEYTRPEAEKWLKKAIASQENGKKGGRPRKGETAEEPYKSFNNNNAL